MQQSPALEVAGDVVGRSPQGNAQNAVSPGQLGRVVRQAGARGLSLCDEECRNPGCARLGSAWQRAGLPVNALSTHSPGRHLKVLSSG